MSGSVGDNVFRASGVIAAAAAGREGTVDWQTDSIKTATFTATSGEGYFANTTGGAFNMNLPAGAAASIVAVKDYLNTFDSNALTIVPDGTDKIGGTNANYTVSTEALSLTLVYVDSTRGWVDIHESTQASEGGAYIAATGGNAILTCGDYKNHVFTGPGTFCVSAGEGTLAKADYFVVAGGGSGGGLYGSAGAGGFRLSNKDSLASMSPLAAACGLDISPGAYPIAVGGGGPSGGTGNDAYSGNNGTPSVFSTITSAGGGFGTGAEPCVSGGPGGSGGSTGYMNCGEGVGNTPPVSPPQGNPSGNRAVSAAGGGGGAGAAGADGTTPPTVGGAGGIGSYIADPFVGPTAPSYGTPGPVSATRYFAGGGGGGVSAGCGAGDGGAGGGGDGSENHPPPFPGICGTANTGGGGAGSAGGLGGSGIVMIRYKFQ